jgi:hypothetical protein
MAKPKNWKYELVEGSPQTDLQQEPTIKKAVQAYDELLNTEWQYMAADHGLSNQEIERRRQLLPSLRRWSHPRGSVIPMRKAIDLALASNDVEEIHTILRRAPTSKGGKLPLIAQSVCAALMLRCFTKLPWPKITKICCQQKDFPHYPQHTSDGLQRCTNSLQKEVEALSNELDAAGFGFAMYRQVQPRKQEKTTKTKHK